MIRTRIRKRDKRQVYDVRLRDPSGRVYNRTFLTRKAAENYELREKADRARGLWIDPRRGKVTVAEWSEQWISERSDLRVRTVELYRGLLRLHIAPCLGQVELGKLTPSQVRTWFAGLHASSGPGASTAAKAYRLLRAMMSTAVADEVIVRNPCQVQRGGIERAAERPIATISEVNALADGMPSRFRALVLLAAWCGLRRGELLALQRRDIDLLHGTVRVERTMHQLSDGSIIVGPPKTEAGRRWVAIPPHIVPELEDHLDAYVGTEAFSLVFTGEKGGPLRPHVLQKAWVKSRNAAGLEGLHLHDLRHSGNTWAAATGASIRELMARMGHANSAAALRYQHAMADRDQAIAQALSELVKPAEVVPITRRAAGTRDGRAIDAPRTRNKSPRKGS